MEDVVIVLSTFGSEGKAVEVVRVLVDERLCACANLLPRVRSIYRWQDAVQDELETLAVIKTTRARLPELTARIAALHGYEVPEVIALPIEAGHAPYLAWLRGATT